MARDDFGDSPKFCKHCGSVSTPQIKTVKEGSALTGFLLTLLMILPGLLYFVFRMRTERFWVCGACGRRGGLIPATSPAARAAVQSQTDDEADIYCTACGKRNNSGAMYCSTCGQRLRVSTNTNAAATPQGYDLAHEAEFRPELEKEGTELSESEITIHQGSGWKGVVIAILILVVFILILHVISKP